ncbi:MAG: nitroreductase family protein [Candidatus Babeliales bacterium]
MKQRTSPYPVLPLILKRWSPRALSGETISDQDLMTLFEAARWAPSSYNNQPWRFIYAKRDTQAWDTLYNLLVDENKIWAKNAAVLIIMISQEKTKEGYNIRTHSFCTGAAWQNLALQAFSMGLVAHGMEGFDYAKATKDLHIPEGYSLEAMCAIGKPGNVKDLPKKLQEREEPSDRQPIESFVFEGTFSS